MFLAIPLETKPTWRSPPWMTALLIAVHCFIYWGWQEGEERAMLRFARQYAATELPALELPLYIGYLREPIEEWAREFLEEEKNPAFAVAQVMYNKGQYADLYMHMRAEGVFYQRLLAGEVIRAQDADYPRWQAARAAFERLEPAFFTLRWAISYEVDAGWQPVRALTSTFLHGSAEHLLGNMVFLFLFGFALEMVLGAWLYLALYLAGGVCASLFALFFYAGMGGHGLGASGAVSALMGMYAVLYRMRRIRFFYMVLFYFNYARWPALVMLPAWLAVELLQHFMGGRGVAYMAHFGGLLAGALSMGLCMVCSGKLRRAGKPPPPGAAAQQEKADSIHLQRAIARARAYNKALDFERAAPAWREAARLAPHNAQVLRAWFDSARHTPEGEDFHAAVRLIFKLPTRTVEERHAQHACFVIYRQCARPGMRLSADTLHALVHCFVRLGEWNDAGQLCRLLERQRGHPQWVETLTLLVNGLIHSGQSGCMAQAQAWLPTLQRDAPQADATRLLAARSKGKAE